ncbi:hypothetical protein ACFL35_13025 [Candidatus Riflebacteria bacterium]
MRKNLFLRKIWWFFCCYYLFFFQLMTAFAGDPALPSNLEHKNENSDTFSVQLKKGTPPIKSGQIKQIKVEGKSLYLIRLNGKLLAFNETQYRRLITSISEKIQKSSPPTLATKAGNRAPQAGELEPEAWKNQMKASLNRGIHKIINEPLKEIGIITFKDSNGKTRYREVKSGKLLTQEQAFERIEARKPGFIQNIKKVYKKGLENIKIQKNIYKKQGADGQIYYQFEDGRAASREDYIRQGERLALTHLSLEESIQAGMAATAGGNLGMLAALETGIVESFQAGYDTSDGNVTTFTKDHVKNRTNATKTGAAAGKNSMRAKVKAKGLKTGTHFKSVFGKKDFGSLPGGKIAREKYLTRAGYKHARHHLRVGLGPGEIIFTLGLTTALELGAQVVRGEKPSLKKVAKIVTSGTFIGGFAGGILGAAAGSFAVPALAAVPVVGGVLAALAPAMGAVTGGMIGSGAGSGLSFKESLKRVNWWEVAGRGTGAVIGGTIGSVFFPPFGTIAGGIIGNMLGKKVGLFFQGIFSKLDDPETKWLPATEEDLQKILGKQIIDISNDEARSHEDIPITYEDIPENPGSD